MQRTHCQDPETGACFVYLREASVAVGGGRAEMAGMTGDEAKRCVWGVGSEIT